MGEEGGRVRQGGKEQEGMKVEEKEIEKNRKRGKWKSRRILGRKKRFPLTHIIALYDVM